MFSVPEGKHHDGECLAHRTMRLASRVIAFRLNGAVGVRWGGAANDLSSSKALLRNSSITPPPAGDRGLKHVTSGAHLTKKKDKSHNLPFFFLSLSAFEMLGLGLSGTKTF